MRRLEFCENEILRKCQRRKCYNYPICVCGLTWDWLAFRAWKVPREVTNIPSSFRIVKFVEANPERKPLDFLKRTRGNGQDKVLLRE